MLFDSEKFKSGTRLLKWKSQIELFQVPQSMIESRRRAMKMDIPFSLLARNLDASNEQLARAYNEASMLDGVLIEGDRKPFYSQLLQILVPMVHKHYWIDKSTGPVPIELLKLSRVDYTPLHQFIDLIPQENQRRNLNSSKRSLDEFAFRIWFKPAEAARRSPSRIKPRWALVSRVLLMIIESHNPEQSAREEIVFYNMMFGNIDLCIIPAEIFYQSNLRPLSIRYASHQDIKLIRPESFIKLAPYLDHGQLLNLAELARRGVHITSNNCCAAAVNRSYEHYFQDLALYARLSENGRLMLKPLPEDTLRLLHLTEYKKEIIHSTQLKSSRAGCMGNMVYTTTLVGDNADQLGGHTIGLYRRKYQNQPCIPERFILLEVNAVKNKLTNWIEKLGRGRIFLEARNQLLSIAAIPRPRYVGSNRVNMGDQSRMGIEVALVDTRRVQFFYTGEFGVHSKINAISAAATKQYAHLYPLFLFLKIYTDHLKERAATNDVLAERLFHRACRFLDQVKVYSNGQPCYSIVNNIFFEVIKDYIILFQSDVSTQKFREIGSFNMDNQYRIFFELFPQLREDWNTGVFPIDIDNVLKVLSHWSIIKSTVERMTFMRFFLDRLAYYVNVGCLEGVAHLPIPTHVESFEELVNLVPNLMGNIFNSIIKQDHGKTTFFKRYSDILRNCYDASYDARGLDVLIKAGMFGTEEIGVRKTAVVNFFNISLSEHNGIYQVNKDGFLKLSLAGISKTNGFTKRVNQYSEEVQSLRINVNDLDDTSFNLSKIAQLIFNNYYLQPFPEPSAETVAARSAKYFEITDPRIPRMTHGAMHAARVAAYVKILHQFRLEQQDAMALQLNEFAQSLGMTAISLIHLTQIAALFHDVSRKDEGEDRWDHVSAEQCFLFIRTILPGLVQHLDGLIANTIAFKDNEVKFKELVASLSFTATQAQSANYLRQLVHDADCLDIMRVRGTFKLRFLDLCNTPNLQNSQAAILGLVKKVRELIHLQGDLYKPCKIEIQQGEINTEEVLEANLNAQRKCEYELNANVYQRVEEDIRSLFPRFGSLRV